METEVSSSYRPPDPKKQLSVRVPTSIHTKLEVIRDYWRAEALSAGGKPEEVEGEIDITYTVVRLLSDKTDEELMHFGGLPPNPEAKAQKIAELKGAPKKKQH